MKLYYKHTLVTLFLMINSNTLMAEDNKDVNNTIIPYKFYNSVIPVIGANPTYGTLYGIAASSGVTLGDPETTKMSNISASAIQTTKDQTMLLIKSVGYTDNNEWMFIEDGRLFFSSQDTYGLGTGETIDGISQTDLSDDDAQSMDFDLLRFHLTLAKKIKPSLYIGGGYMYDEHKNIKDLEFDEKGTSSYHDYSIKHGFNLEKTTSSGVSLDLIYDTRNNIATPTKGMYAFASYKYLPEFLGSDQDSSSLWLEFRDYFNISKDDPRKLLTLWSYFNTVTSGETPYMDLPALGWDQFGRSGRGYTQGRFRGEDLFYTELELRMPLEISKNHPDRYGYTLFANITSASDEDRNQDVLNDFGLGGGVGFRYLINKETKANLAIDLALAENGTSSFYLNMNEAF